MFDEMTLKKKSSSCWVFKSFDSLGNQVQIFSLLCSANRCQNLVVTMYAGLYRYQVGDILRVTGFHNSAPQFHVVRSKNVFLSIDSDKTDEAELQNADQNSSQLRREFNTSVVEYTSYAAPKTMKIDKLRFNVTDSLKIQDEQEASKPGLYAAISHITCAGKNIQPIRMAKIVLIILLLVLCFGPLAMAL